MACDSSIFRPIDSFIKYFGDIKPYHTKILEVVEQYIFRESIDVVFEETPSFEVTLSNNPLCKGVGFGLNFDDDCGFDALDCCDLFECVGGFGLIFDNSDLLVSTPVTTIEATGSQIVVPGFHLYDTYLNIKSIPDLQTIIVEGNQSTYFDAHNMFWVVRKNSYPINSITSLSTITILGDVAEQLLAKVNIEVQNSGANDGHYGVLTATYSSGTGLTTVLLNRNLVNTDLGSILVDSSTKNNGVYQIDGYTINLDGDTELELTPDTPARLINADVDNTHGSVQLRTGFIPNRKIWIENDSVVANNGEWKVTQIWYDTTLSATVLVVDGTLQDSSAVGITINLYGYETGAGFDGLNECSEPQPFNINAAISEFLLIEVNDTPIAITPTPTISATPAPTSTPTATPASEELIFVGDWFLTTDWPLEGESLRSAVIGNNQSSSTQVTVTVGADKAISFNYLISSEEGFDFLTVTVNGNEELSVSGLVESSATIPLDVGENVIVWTYSKDSSAVDNDDAAFIDEVAIVDFVAPFALQFDPITVANDYGWNEVAFGNGTFVAVNAGFAERVMTSPDGINWTEQVAAENNSWNCIAFGNGIFVASSFSGTNRFMYSSDGINWTATPAPVNWFSNDITFGNGMFVAVGSSSEGNMILTSTDGITWDTPSVTSVFTSLSNVGFGNGLFLAIANGPAVVVTSPDGINWTDVALPSGLTNHNGIAYGNGNYVILSESGSSGVPGAVIVSPDAVNWTNYAVPVSRGFNKVEFAEGIFVASSSYGPRVLTSFNGIDWISGDYPSTAEDDAAQWRGIAYGDGKFVVLEQVGNRVGVPEVLIATWPTTPGTSPTPTVTPTITVTPTVTPSVSEAVVESLYTQTVMASGPLHYWKFGEENVIDYTGNGNDLTLFDDSSAGNAGILVDGIDDSAGFIIGDPDYTVNRGWTIGTPLAASSFVSGHSFEGWVKLTYDEDGFPYSGCILGSNNSSFGLELYIQSNFGDGTGDVFFYYDGSSAGDYSIPAEWETWFHVALTVDSNNDWKIYYNGTEVLSGLDATPAMVYGYVGTTVGVEMLNGRIDEVAFYDRVLSPSEILDHYTVGAALVPAPSLTPTPTPTPTPVPAPAFVWDAAKSGAGIVITESGKRLDSSTTNSLSIVTASIPAAGKYYWETSIDNIAGYSAPSVGLVGEFVGTPPVDYSSQFGGYVGNQIHVNVRDNFIYYNGGLVGSFPDSPANDTIRFAFDTITGNIWIGSIALGIWFGGGDPETDTSPIGVLPADTYYMAAVPTKDTNISSVLIRTTGVEVLGALPTGYSLLE